MRLRSLVVILIKELLETKRKCLSSGVDDRIDLCVQPSSSSVSSRSDYFIVLKDGHIAVYAWCAD